MIGDGGRRAAVARPPAPIAVRDVTAALLRGSIITAAAYLALAVAAVPFAELLAVLAGFCGVLPKVGPVLSGLVCVLAIGAPLLEVGATALIGLAWLTHRHVLRPLLRTTAGPLTPAVAAAGVLLGAAFAGVPGAAAAMPAVVVVNAIMAGRREPAA